MSSGATKAISTADHATRDCASGASATGASSLHRHFAPWPCTVGLPHRFLANGVTNVNGAVTVTVTVCPGWIVDVVAEVLARRVRPPATP